MIKVSELDFLLLFTKASDKICEISSYIVLFGSLPVYFGIL